MVQIVVDTNVLVAGRRWPVLFLRVWLKSSWTDSVPWAGRTRSSSGGAHFWRTPMMSLCWNWPCVVSVCDYLITFNQRHFAPSATFGIQVVTPHEFLTIMKV